MIRTIIIEDDPMVAQINCQYLQPLGDFQIDGIFNSGAAAQEYLKENEADLAIVDIYMPGMNGIELLRWIRGDHRNLSVIMVTAATEIQTVAEALQLGIVDYLIKPFSFARFQEAVQKYLRKEDVLKHSHTANQTMLDQLLNAAPANLNFETQDLRKGLNQMTETV